MERPGRFASLAAALVFFGATASSCSSSDDAARSGTGSVGSTPPDGSVSTSPSGAAVHTGPWIAFQAQNADGDGIYLVQPDGANNHEIVTDVPGDAVHPDWSPDGTRLVFVAYRGDSGDVWVADADGQHPREVARCRGGCLFYDYVVWVPGHDPKILMVRDDGPTLRGTPVPGSSVLEVLDLRTGRRRDVVTSAHRQFFSSVNVSPDGRRYCAGVEIGDTGEGITGSAIVVGEIAGGATTMVTDPQEYGANCDWRPHGDLLVYTTYGLNAFPDMAEDSNLYTIAPDGSHRRQLTHFARGVKRATQPSWTPDGSRLLFTLVQGDGYTRQMATVSARGDDLQWATGSDPQTGTHPVLQPVH